MKNHIDVDGARVFFTYDKDTGILTNAYSRGPAKAGKEAGTPHFSGAYNTQPYRRVMFNGVFVRTHRLIWAIVTGEQADTIDHIDGNGLNNRWCNLRNVPHKVNCRNQKLHTTNTSGTSGVTYRKDSGKWRSRIRVNDVSINLGTFPNKDDAIQARKEGEIKYWS